MELLHFYQYRVRQFRRTLFRRWGWWKAGLLSLLAYYSVGHSLARLDGLTHYPTTLARVSLFHPEWVVIVGSLILLLPGWLSFHEKRLQATAERCYALGPSDPWLLLWAQACEQEIEQCYDARLRGGLGWLGLLTCLLALWAWLGYRDLLGFGCVGYLG